MAASPRCLGNAGAPDAALSSAPNPQSLLAFGHSHLAAAAGPVNGGPITTLRRQLCLRLYLAGKCEQNGSDVRWRFERPGT